MTALTTTQITGRIALPDDVSPANAKVVFELASYDTDATSDVTVISLPIYGDIDGSGDIDVDVWSQDRGTRSRLYKVSVEVRQSDRTVTVPLGPIEVPSDAGPYDLNDLLPLEVPAGATVADFLAQLEASAARAETAETAAAASETAAIAARDATIAAAATTFNTDAAFIAADLTAYPDGTVVNVGGRPELKSTGVTGYSKADWTPLNVRTAIVMQWYVDNLPDGSVFQVGGLFYKTDATATGANSATNDLGIGGLLPFLGGGGVSFRHFGASESAGDNKSAIDACISYVKSAGVLTIQDAGAFSTSGGHVLDGVCLSSSGAVGLTFNHVDASTVAGAYIQTATTVTVSATGHGLKVGETAYLDFTTGTANNGHYTIATAPDADTFTVLAATATASGNVTVYPGTCCVKEYIADPNASIMGTGVSNMRIINQTTSGFAIGHMTQNYAHTRVDNVEVRDYDAAGEFGFLWENYNGKWTESGVYSRMRATNCYNHFTMRQNIGAAGTLSMGYNRFDGTASSSATGAKNVTIDGVSVYDNPKFAFNLYMSEDAAARGLRIINSGRLNGCGVQVVGEKPGGGSHTALEIDGASQMRDSTGYMKFENGLISIASSATLVNNNMPISSSGENVFLRYDTRVSVSARQSGNYTLASATWAGPTAWTEDEERPSGGNNTTSGLFTAPTAGIYFVSASACFTPQVGDNCRLRIATTSRNFVLAQEEAVSTADLVLSGCHAVAMDAGDTAQMQVYTSNAGGDTIRASDSDGSKTLFGVQYIAS